MSRPLPAEFDAFHIDKPRIEFEAFGLSAKSEVYMNCF
jgi:hypothetical protein